jgi:hypothetical protein
VKHFAIKGDRSALKQVRASKLRLIALCYQCFTTLQRVKRAVDIAKDFGCHRSYP